MELSTGGDMTKSEWKHWLKWSAICIVIPTLISFLTTLQGAIAHGHLLPDTQDLTFAFGTAYGTIIASLIKFLATYYSDNTK